ncbi:MAG: methyltransferase domain-containing protein [Verrucomicrobia bacterium]|nr:methyltransferase domain-containing protein [Verrucomicrobiota bacterium]
MRTFLRFTLVFLVAQAPLLRGAEQATEILQTSGVKGGLVVHVGCGDGKLTAALRANNSYLVHGLDADVTAARKHIQSLGLYGTVSAAQWDGKRLPYIENFVNLIVVSDSARVSNDEIMRVLVPNGVAIVGGQKIVKPRSKSIDEWTHYLHDASGNAVAHDTEIGFLARMQWLAGPRYSRHHDHMSVASAMVSANGRNFYIFDEAPRASIFIPPQWFLYARDSFNGTLLWRRPIERWHEHMYPLKSGPGMLPRRIVAMGDKLYATLNIDAPLTELDAATGKTLRTFDNTGVTEEIILSDGVLFLAVADKQPLRSDPKKVFATLADIRADVTGPQWGDLPRTVVAIEVSSGRLLWKKITNLMPATLAADNQSVYLHDGVKVVCLNRKTGAPVWATETPCQRTLKASSTPTLVVYDDVLLFSGYSGDAKKLKGEGTTMYALSARTGKRLWEAEHPPQGHAGSPKDLLVIKGVVWYGDTAQGSGTGNTTGRDIHTGKVVKEFPPDVKTHWFHQRCYRQKATENFLFFSRTGIEFVDIANAHWTCHHWVRGACLYGFMPANGMIYNAPNPCACYLDAKLSGFNALAPMTKLWQPKREVSDEGRLIKSDVSDFTFEMSDSDWPTYRGNAARSGYVKTTVPATELKSTWEMDLGGKITSPVIAGGLLFVAVIDRHEIVSLDASTGRKLWSYTAGGRIDSPPTIWEGRVLFGGTDGYVYCLRATDGAFAWRFRAAPEDRRHFCFEQLESVWPVSGSVLVQSNTLYCVAGRSMFLDGGLRIFRLDPKTGKKLTEIVMDDNDPITKTNLQSHIKGLNMPTALADILSSDGKNVYMRTLVMDMDGKRRVIGVNDVKDQQGDDRHLFSPTGFLDDTMWHRTYWTFGRAFASGAGGYYQAGRVTPSGRMLVFDDKNVYGFGRLWQYYRWTTPIEHHLFSAPRDPEQVRMGSEPPKRPKKADGKPKGTLNQRPLTRFAHEWSNELSMQVTSMALADKTLFVAGVPDLVDEEKLSNTLGDLEVKKKLAEQEAALEGKRGALLAAIGVEDGKKIATYRLKAAPVFDGLATAYGQVYLSTLDGKVHCFGAGGSQPLPAATDQVVTPRGDADKPTGEIPPVTTSKGKGAAKAAPKTAPKTGTKPEQRTHPDFHVLSAVTVTSGGLGYKLTADEGENGLALKQLAAPLTKPVIFTLKIQPNTGGKLQTGFLVFGDGAAEDKLIKCGVRLRTKKCYIIQGAAKTGTTMDEFVSEAGKSIAVEVTVDFAAKKVRMTLPGKAIEAPLTAPLKQITHVGYYVMNAVTEFSPVEIK